MRKILPLFILLLSCSSSKQTDKVETFRDKDIAFIKAKAYENLGTKLNEIYTTEIGENIIVKIHGSFYDGILLKNKATGSLFSTKKEIVENTELKKVAQIANYDLYKHSEMASVGIAINRQTKASKMTINTGGKEHLVYTRTPIEYKEIEIINYSSEYYKKEIIYNGKVGDAIKFTYREFTDNIARPAFTQDLQYDLSESNIIGFKGLRIQIEKATNTNITYIVLKDFD